MAKFVNAISDLSAEFIGLILIIVGIAFAINDANKRRKAKVTQGNNAPVSPTVVDQQRKAATAQCDSASGSLDTHGRGQFWDPPTIVGVVVGLAGGIAIAAKTMEGIGDAPSGGGALFCLSLATSLVGGAAGKLASEAWAFKARRGSILRLALALVFLPLLCGFWFTVWSGTKEGADRIRSMPAESDLRNCRLALEDYLADHQRYPPSLEDAHCMRSTGVVMIAEKLTVDEYVLVAYHRKGDREFMIRSTAPQMFMRKTGSGEEWMER